MSPRCFSLLLGIAAATVLHAQTASPFASGVWSGGVTATSATVAVRLTSSAQRVRLHVSPNASLSPAIFSSMATTAATTGNTLKLSVSGLQPDTDYYYGIEVAGVLRTEAASRGRFRTFPLGGGSFKIAFASCSSFTAPDQRAFDALLVERPLLFIHMGDLHYVDTNTTNADDYRANYDGVLNQPNQSAFYRGVPMAYTWDDHDFCGNNSDTTFVGRDTARAVYRERVPHYPLAANAGSTIAQAFTIGRVRVLMTDMRSGSDAASKADTASKTHFGAAQKAWFKQELVSARDAGFPMILWVCSNPWIGAVNPAEDVDNWASYATERREMANFIRDNRITNVTILAGDMHALAYDDGTHADYATGGGAQIEVLHAAALTQEGSIKGGPYTGGPIPGGQQYGILEVYDNGGPSVACRFLGMRAGEGQKLSFIFSSSPTGSTDRAIVNISTLARVTSPSDSIVSGFVISGSTKRSMLVRAVGPTLAAFGVADALAGVSLEVYQGDRLIASNDGWARTTEGAGPLTDAFDRSGAFRLLDESSGDAALVLSLPPAAYTIQVKSAGGKPGAALIEVYEVR